MRIKITEIHEISPMCRFSKDIVGKIGEAKNMKEIVSGWYEMTVTFDRRVRNNLEKTISFYVARCEVVE